MRVWKPGEMAELEAPTMASASQDQAKELGGRMDGGRGLVLYEHGIT